MSTRVARQSIDLQVEDFPSLLRAGANPRSLRAGRLILLRSGPALPAEIGLPRRLLGAATEPRSGVRSFEYEGQTYWLKLGTLRGHSRWRHNLRCWTLGRELPRVAEFNNLRWLRARLFRTPQPRAAGWIQTRGWAWLQFCLLEDVPDSQPLDQAWPKLDASEQTCITAESAREVARLHALGFVHRDLYPRNFLVSKASHTEDPRRLTFLDAWRGGPCAVGLGARLAEFTRRGISYDLGCWHLWTANTWGADAGEEWLKLYFAARARESLSSSQSGLSEALLRRGMRRAEQSQLVRMRKDPERWRDFPRPNE